MSKALVIKGANFASYAVRQITLSDPVECTGITLDQSTLAFTAIGDTATLTPTVTPADTTDTITWTSSDEAVATVADGVVTCVGIGSATITAYCGEQSATCTVTVSSITIVLDSTYDIITGYTFGGYNLSTGKTYCSLSSEAYAEAYCSEENLTGGYKAFYDIYDDSYSQYPLPIPNGATSMQVTCSVASHYIMLAVFDTYTQASARPSSSSAWSSAVVGNVNGRDTITMDLSSLSSANGYAVCHCNLDSDTKSEADLDATTTVTFS